MNKQTTYRDITASVTKIQPCVETQPHPPNKEPLILLLTIQGLPPNLVILGLNTASQEDHICPVRQRSLFVNTVNQTLHPLHIIVGT